MKFIFTFFFLIPTAVFSEILVECYPVNKNGLRECELHGIDYDKVVFQVPCKLPEKKIKKKVENDFIKKNRERKRRFRK